MIWSESGDGRVRDARQGVEHGLAIAAVGAGREHSIHGELWHGTWEGDDDDIRRVDPSTGEVLARLTMPEGTEVTGLESDGGNVFFAGGAGSGRIREVRRPRRGTR